jgi:predicted GH43/DUF377 family glycosyl hydrolase
LAIFTIYQSRCRKSSFDTFQQTSFYLPNSKKEVKWEEKDVFNPAAVVRDGKVYLVYRAEDKIGKFAGTSRLGLAISSDGLHFKKEAKPIFYPENDAQKSLEWEGGCEDPRIVESAQGQYIMTYTSYDGKTARLMLATSKDLRKWTKHGLVFKAPNIIIHGQSRVQLWWIK